MISASDVIANAREWIGVKFLHQGRTRLGCDCAGFISGCMAEVGSPIFLQYLPLAYARDPRGDLIEGLPELSRQIELQPAALVMIKFPLMTHAAHAAIYLGDGRMIHSDQKAGGVVEHGYENPWKARTVSIWAMPGVMYR